MTRWMVQRTLLLVGEGAHEVAFLEHTKSLYVTRGCGLSVKIMNARGKGAKHVVEYTAKLLQNRSYDACAVLLDTDTDFTSKVESFAEAQGIQLLLSVPCFEAMLLRMLSEKAGGTAKNLKKKLLPFVNGDPTKPRHYAKRFPHVVLEKACESEEAIERLVSLFVMGMK